MKNSSLKLTPKEWAELKNKIVQMKINMRGPKGIAVVPQRAVVRSPAQASGMAPPPTKEDLEKIKAQLRKQTAPPPTKADLEKIKAGMAAEPKEGLLAFFGRKAMGGINWADQKFTDVSEYLGATKTDEEGREVRADIAAPVLAVGRTALNVADVPSGVARQAIYTKKPLKDILRDDFLTPDGRQAMLSSGFPSTGQYLNEMDPEYLSDFGKKVKGLQTKLDEAATPAEGKEMDWKNAFAEMGKQALPIVSDLGIGVPSVVAPLRVGAKVAKMNKFGKTANALNKTASGIEYVDPTRAVGGLTEFGARQLHKVPYKVSGVDNIVAGPKEKGSLRRGRMPSDVMWRRGGFTNSIASAEAIKKAVHAEYDAALDWLRKNGRDITPTEMQELYNAMVNKHIRKNAAAYQREALAESGSVKSMLDERYKTPSMDQAEKNLTLNAENTNQYIADQAKYQQDMKNFKPGKKPNQYNPNPVQPVMPTPPTPPTPLPTTAKPVTMEEFVDSWRQEKAMIPKTNWITTLTGETKTPMTRALKDGTQRRYEILKQRGGAGVADTLVSAGKDEQALIALAEELAKRESGLSTLGDAAEKSALITSNPHFAAARATSKSGLLKALRKGASHAITAPTQALKTVRNSSVAGMKTKGAFDHILNQSLLGALNSGAETGDISIPKRGVYLQSREFLLKRALEQDKFNEKAADKTQSQYEAEADEMIEKLGLDPRDKKMIVENLADNVPKKDIINALVLSGRRKKWPEDNEPAEE